LSTYVTPHFLFSEMSCHDGTPVPDELKPNVRRLCSELLERIRSRWGGAIVVISGYRSPAYNRAVGGAKHSQHVLGTAADIRCANLDDLPRLKFLIDTMIKGGELPALGGYGVYANWLHVDCRDKPADGHIAQWTGNKVGSEVA
jgi:uncharacterized protein YcbK (DUF882 family)